MSLDHMTLNQLRELALTLGNLEQAGATLAVSGLEPVFHMTPGFSIGITVPFMMPQVSETMPGNVLAFLVNATKQPIAPQPPEMVLDTQFPSTVAAPDPAGEEVMLSPAPVVESPPVTDPAGGQSDPEPETPSESPVIEQTPAPQAADDSGPSAGGQGSGSSPMPPGATDFIVGPLSDDEKTYIRVMNERGKTNAAIATALNRRVQTIGLYLTQVERAAAAQMKSDPVQDPAPLPDPAPAIEVDTTLPPAPVPRPAAQTDSYDAYYAQIRADGWDLGLDQALMHLAMAGWKMGDIGLDLGVDARKVQARYDALTGLTKLTGKEGTSQLRLYARADVQAWLISQSARAAE